MKEKRVVITGIGAICAFGRNWQEVNSKFKIGKNAVKYIEEWQKFIDLEAKIAAPILDYQAPKHWTRKQLRSMGTVAQYAVDCAEQALIDADLLDSAELKNGSIGVACGSSAGSTRDIQDAGLLLGGYPNQFNANTYVRMMPHTTAANIAIFFGITGRLIPTSSACTSGSQAIGYAYESIKYGKIPMMLAGGSEQLCPSEVFVFDSLYAASRCNDTPELSPRPYDKNRDGLVIGEGAAILVLEELEHALKRNAKIYAEIIGYGANCDGEHITRPKKETMQACMQLALDDAQIAPSKISYINGHGTATEQGDIAETLATYAIFGKVPFSSQKSFLGHTLGACGALETWFSVEMMNDNSFAPTINLNEIDPRCADLDYIQHNFRDINSDYVMNNNFAFGGVNTSLILKKYL